MTSFEGSDRILIVDGKGLLESNLHKFKVTELK